LPDLPDCFTLSVPSFFPQAKKKKRGTKQSIEITIFNAKKAHIPKKSIIFAPELTWTDLYCLQPQEKMLKRPYLFIPAISANNSQR